MISIRRALGWAVVLLLALVIVLPAVVVKGCVGGNERGFVRGGVPVTVALFCHATNSVVKMDLEQYIIGVLAAEMPAAFEPEALKAQAIVARTYAVSRLRCFGGAGCECHTDADICDDPAHGQAWVSEQQARHGWGFVNAGRYWAKCVNAVKATEASLLFYEGLPIEPAFHSTCGGRTEDSGAVWQKSLPYLKSVECGWCGASPKTKSTLRLSVDEIARLVSSDCTASDAAQQSETTIRVLERTASGRVQSVGIGSLTVRATELRKVLGLASTWFECTQAGQTIVFECTGYGHGVGLCQYGANGMAKQSYSAEQILSHYFPDTTVGSMWEVR